MVKEKVAMSKEEEKLKLEKEKAEAERIAALGKAGDIWNEIKDIELSLYALPEQKLSAHAQIVDIPGDDLHLKLKSTAVVSALEEALVVASKKLKSQTYELEQHTNYTVVKKVAKIDI